ERSPGAARARESDTRDQRHAARGAAAARSPAAARADRGSALRRRDHGVGEGGARGRLRGLRRARPAAVPGASFAGLVAVASDPGGPAGARRRMAALSHARKAAAWAGARLAELARAGASCARQIERFALPLEGARCGAEPRARSRAPCPACAASIPRLDRALCVRCLAAGRPAPGCGREPGFEAFAAWIYEERAAFVVQALKYRSRPRLADALGRPIANALPSAYRPQLVLEVPLHPARRPERG